ncbi:MAG TPA: Crp/Fnr family transcriptional regulator [Vicinamibacterales bacterium]|nr:Crp/Fnr family transcriptional regulator [Vicinamibacterales bacterium]
MVEQDVLRNRLLAALPESERARLLPHLSPVAFRPRETLHGDDEPLRAVCFPTGGLYSIMTPAVGGERVEVAAVGVDGLIGVLGLLGVEAATGVALAQTEATAVRIDLDILRREALHCPELRRLAGRYAHALIGDILQWVACNRLHSLEQRCARWLLAAADASASDTLRLTHDLIAEMLGVRRPSVTLAMRALQRAGAVASSRGRVAIVDREALQRAACPCYGLVRRRYEGLLTG